MNYIPRSLFTAGGGHATVALQDHPTAPPGEPTLLLSVTSPRTGIATAHLSPSDARALLAALHTHLATTSTDSDSDMHHIHLGDRPPATHTDDFDPWGGHAPGPAYVTDPGPLDIDPAQTALTHATRERDHAATRFARVHCHHAAYTVIRAFPTAAWITVDVTSTDHGNPQAILHAVLDLAGLPLAEQANTDPRFRPVADTVNQALQTALTINPNLFTWSGRRSLHLSHHATW
jgi:hypothetical protein